MKRFLLPLLGTSLLFGCPSPKEVVEKFKTFQISFKAIYKISPVKEIPFLCKVEGIVKSGNFTSKGIFYITSDGRYFIPQIERIVYKDTPIKNLKRLVAVDVKNPQNNFTIGYVTSDLKFYFPLVIPINTVEPKKNNLEPSPFSN